MSGSDIPRRDRELAAELLGAWALDALDAAERDLVESAIASDPELAAEAALLRTAAHALPHGAAAAPPPGMRATVLGRLDDRRQDAPAETGGARADRDADPANRGAGTPPAPAEERSADSTVTPIGRGSAGRTRRRLFTVLGAAAAVLAVVAGLTVGDDSTISEREQTTAIAAITDAPGSQHHRMPMPTGGTIEIAVGADGAAVVAADEITEAGPGRTYQLWVIEGEQDPASRGLLPVVSGRALTAIDQVPVGSTFAITVEPEGGSAAPTTDPIVAIPTG